MSFAATTGHDVTSVPAHWYCRGTHVQTPSGQRPVEELAQGDSVINASGQTILVLWTGQCVCAGASAAGQAWLQPLVISQDAIGPRLPQRDLWLSPAMTVLLDGVAAPARALLNGQTVRQPLTWADVSYIGLQVEGEEPPLAEGIAAGFSPADGGNRVDRVRLRLERRAQQTRLLAARRAAIRSEAGAAAA